MVKIEYPIVEHIMHSKNFGFNDFILALGYKGYFIKIFQKKYRVSLIDTGVKTLTGGRLLRLNILNQVKILCLLTETEYQIKISKNYITFIKK